MHVKFLNTAVVFFRDGDSPCVVDVDSPVDEGEDCFIDLSHMAVHSSVLFQDVVVGAGVPDHLRPFLSHLWLLLRGAATVPLWVLCPLRRCGAVVAKITAWTQSMGLRAGENVDVMTDQCTLGPATVPSPRTIVVSAVPPIHLDRWAVVEMHDLPPPLTLQQLPCMLWRLRGVHFPSLDPYVPRCENSAFWAHAPTALRKWTSVPFRQMVTQFIQLETCHSDGGLDDGGTSNGSCSCSGGVNPEADRQHAAVATQALLRRFISERCVCSSHYSVPLPELRREFLEFCDLQRASFSGAALVSEVLLRMTTARWAKLPVVEDCLLEAGAHVNPSYVNRKYRGRRYHTLFVTGITLIVS